MELFASPKDYLFNLQTTSKADAKRLWRKGIREKWNHECAYCGSKENLTLDHIIPQSKGGLDVTKNVLCCCHSCNQSKGHIPWKEWYDRQEFYSEERNIVIYKWIEPEKPQDLFSYRMRRNNTCI
jgi:hypothetical protein